jgi:hydroxysqualene synthase
MDNAHAVSVEHYENFPVASWLCPKPLRAPITAIYHFARTADDIADEGDAPSDERRRLLQAYRLDLQRVAQGQPPSPAWAQVFTPLSREIDRWQLPIPLLDDLLDAFEQDTANPRYANRSELLDYCRRSANPVGRLLLHLYGVHDAAALARSDAICSALQLINFWQDLSVDLPRDRCYVPTSDAQQHGLTLDSLRTGPADAAHRDLLRTLTDWARQLMLEGAPLVHQVPGRGGWELRAVVQGGLRILEKIEHMDTTSFDRRPTLQAADLMLIAWRCLWMRPA